jgi:hypothetical protein
MAPPPKKKKFQKKRKSSPSKDTATASKKPRARNFSSAEDVILCRAYVNVTTNPITGVGQKASQFWQSIKEKFDAIFDSEGIEEEGGKEQRSADALLNRSSA